MSSAGFLHATRVAGADVMDFKNCLLIGGSLFCRRVVSILGMVLAVLVVVGVCAQAQDAVGIGPTTLGSASGAVTVPLTFSAAGTLGSVEVLAEGATGAEFSDVGTGICNTTTSFVANSTCNVNVTFAPAYAGLRKGAVVLKDLTGT